MKTNFDNLFSQFGINLDSSKIDYGRIVHPDGIVAPIRVAQILGVPRSQIKNVEGIVGTIVPYNPIDDEENFSNTLSVFPYRYIYSILFALIQDLAGGDIESANKKARYIEAISPYFLGSSLVLSPQESDSQFFRIGTLNTPEQMANPYEHTERIFQEMAFA